MPQIKPNNPIKRCGSCKYAITANRFATNVTCSITHSAMHGISSRACDKYETRDATEYPIKHKSKRYII